MAEHHPSGGILRPYDLYAENAREASGRDLSEKCRACRQLPRPGVRVADLPGGGLAHAAVCAARAANGGQMTWAEVIAEAKLTYRCPVHDRQLLPAKARERLACPARDCKVSVQYG